MLPPSCNDGAVPAADLVIIGGGCAGLSLGLRLAEDPGKLRRVVILEGRSAYANDRTWCFWEKGNGFFESIVFRKWDHLFFKTDGQSISLDIHPYQYKMIRGIDFYKHCFDCIESQKNIDIIFGNISFENEFVM